MAESMGRVTVSQEVLNTIVRLTTLGVEGVARFDKRPGRRRGADGYSIEVSDNQADVTVYVIVKPETSLREVGQNIQSGIARALQELVGMQVSRVNVHIQDVEPASGA
jgi:uncharacterized alkaline shock family protein YloU